MGVSLTTGVESGGFITLLDEASSTVTYVGSAAPRSSQEAPVWRVQRITATGSLLAVEYADGNAHYDNVWADRASLEYA